jgi:hypothetical protein
MKQKEGSAGVRRQKGCLNPEEVARLASEKPLEIGAYLFLTDNEQKTEGQMWGRETGLPQMFAVG